jgi:hypothetical protein
MAESGAVNLPLRFCDAPPGTGIFRGATWITGRNHNHASALLRQRDTNRRATMPILLLVGVPVFLLGGGYLIIHAMH